MRRTFPLILLTIFAPILEAVATGLDNPLADEWRSSLRANALPLLALAILAGLCAGLLLERMEKEERSPLRLFMAAFAIVAGSAAAAVAGLASNFAAEALPEPIQSVAISHAGLLRIAGMILLVLIAIGMYALSGELRRPTVNEREAFLTLLGIRYHLLQQNALRLAVRDSLTPQDDLREMIQPPLARLEGDEGEHQWERPQPPNTRITHLYSQAKEKLLIVGKAGAGKTFQLLELATWLVEDAQQHLQQFNMPVIFSLASWATERKPLEEWMKEELVEVYQRSPKEASAWVEHKVILPLFDGLNEVKEKYREDCTLAIIKYHDNRPDLPIVVCCRQEEYSALQRSTRAELRNAVTHTVVVQPLKDTQIERFLAGGTGLQGLSEAITADPQLRSAVTTPLMLTIIALTYQHMKQTDIPRPGSEEQEWRRRIFGAYVRWALNRPMGRAELLEPDTLDERAPIRRRRTKRDWLRRGRPHSEEVTYAEPNVRRYLIWLAAQMEKHGQRDFFYLHRLQWTWLPGERERPPIELTWNKRWTLRGLGFWLKVGAAIWGAIALFIGISIGISIGVSIDALTGLAAGVVVGAIVGSLFSLLGLSFGYVGMPANWIEPLPARPMDEKDARQPDAGVRRSRKNGWVGGVLAGLVYVVGISLTLLAAFLLVGVVLAVINDNPDSIPDPRVIAGLALVIALAVGVPTGVLTWRNMGGGAYRQHMKLRRQLVRADHIPRDFVGFLEFAAKHALLDRVGGGYRFIHDQLLQYFVDLAANEESREVVAVVSASQSTE